MHIYNISFICQQIFFHYGAIDDMLFLKDSFVQFNTNGAAIFVILGFQSGEG